MVAATPMIPRCSSRLALANNLHQVFRFIPFGRPGNGSSKLPSPPSLRRKRTARVMALSPVVCRVDG